MQIEVLSSTISVMPTTKGSYKMAEIAFKDEQGKVNGKKVMDFVCKKGFDLFVAGARLDITMVKEAGKDGKEYWQWKEAAPAGSVPSKAAGVGSPAPRSTYETPEERATKQNYIIRQSCLSNAIATLKTEKNTPSASEVASLAEDYVKFIYYKVNSTGFEDMQDDVPD